MIVNNVAAYAGGGVALAEADGSVSLVNNTVASNVSTATNRQAASQGGWAFPSNPQVAGIWVLGGSDPTLLNNIVWGNRSYIYLIDKITDPTKELRTVQPGDDQRRLHRTRTRGTAISDGSSTAFRPTSHRRTAC